MPTNSKSTKRSTRRDKFKFPFELSEEQIAIKLGFYFGLLEAGLGREFELEPSDEAMTGADHEYEGIMARYYLQAKAPIGLLSTEKVAIDKGKEDEGLNVIRKFRKENHLREDPYSLCFPLRRPAKHAKVPEQLQHNLLYAMHDEANRSYAMYVAPTTYEKSEYLRLLRDKSHWEFLEDGPFWRISERRLMLYSQVVTDVLMNMPFLQAHICIVPHDKVESHEHYYSYSGHANDVAFHSPTILDGSSINLSDFLATQMRRNSLTSAGEVQSIDAVADNLKRTLPESVLAEINANQQESSIGWIKRVGAILKKEYGIHQYLLVKKRR